MTKSKSSPYTTEVVSRVTTNILTGRRVVGYIIRSNKQWWILKGRKPIWPDGFGNKKVALAKFTELVPPTIEK